MSRGSRSGSLPVATAENLLHVSGLQSSGTDLQQCSGYIADLVMKESVTLDSIRQEKPAPRKLRKAHSSDLERNRASGRSESRKIVPTCHHAAGRLHAPHVEMPSEVKHVVGEERGQNRTIVDPVFVSLSPRVSLSMKSPVYGSQTHDPNIRWQNRIEGSSQSNRCSHLRETEMSHLSPRVDSSIGASGSDDRTFLATDSEDRLLEFTLNGSAIGLNLPARVSGSPVMNQESILLHWHWHSLALAAVPSSKFHEL